jgi:hypothetical protein
MLCSTLNRNKSSRHVTTIGLVQYIPVQKTVGIVQFKQPAFHLDVVGYAGTFQVMQIPTRFLYVIFAAGGRRVSGVLMLGLK